MKSKFQQLLYVSKFAFAIVTLTLIAFSAVYLVAGSSSKANAVACDAVGDACNNLQPIDCPLNDNEEPVCPLDTPSDKVDQSDDSRDPAPDPDPGPQVLAATTDGPFTGK